MIAPGSSNEPAPQISPPIGNRIGPPLFAPHVPADPSTRPSPPSIFELIGAHMLKSYGSAALDAITAPGRILQSTTPISTEDMIGPALNFAGMLTLGAGAVPAEANALRAGIRPYRNVPDSLMGFRKNGPQRGFHENNYPNVQDIEITMPASNGLPQETWKDQIKGMNPDHSIERAWRNWPDALHITPLGPNRT